jgi:hypothetical protein
MRAFLENKRLILLLAVLALGALTVLAITLKTVPFREGQHFGQTGVTDFQVTPEEMDQIWVEVPLWKQIIVWGLAGLMLILIGLLLSPEMRRRLLRIFIRVAFTFWAIYFLIKRGIINPNLFGGGEAPPSQDTIVPLPAFEPPQVSPTFSYLISFAIALIWLAVIWLLYRGWKRYVSMSVKKPLDEIAKIARSSLNDLSSGRNSSDVIINCYLRMSDVVSDKRHLHRTTAMTPHEFALHLEQAGLPGDAVIRLTRLFEGVRYGARKSGPQDINEAVSCLKTILHYCGEAV